MTPFADTVGLINGDTGQFALGMNDSQNFTKVITLAEFRSDIE